MFEKFKEHRKAAARIKAELAVKASARKYILTHGLNRDRDFGCLNDLIARVGSKYLKEAQITYTGTPELINNKNVEEDRIRLVSNVFTSLSPFYKEVLYHYFDGEQCLVDFIVICFCELDIEIIKINSTKIAKMRGMRTLRNTAMETPAPHRAESLKKN